MILNLETKDGSVVTVQITSEQVDGFMDKLKHIKEHGGDLDLSEYKIVDETKGDK
jgi:hypothetical protein